MKIFNDVKGAQNNIMIIVLLVVAYLLWQGDVLETTPTVSNISTLQPQTPISENIPTCNVEDTTVTFSHVDLYSQSTPVVQGVRILSFDSDRNTQVSNAGTKSYSPGDSYKVLSGNITTSLNSSVDGISYYPQYQEGILPCIGTSTIQGKLAKATNSQDLIYSFRNDNDAINTAQSIGASEKKIVRIRFVSPNDVCFGNPYVAERGGKNVMCFTFPTDTISSVELIGADSTTIPKSASAVIGNDTSCYKWDVICDNGEYNGKVLITSSSTNPTSGNNISISIHDITFDYDAETMELITGVEDEAKTRNDIGVMDFNTGANWDYSIALS